MKHAGFNFLYVLIATLIAACALAAPVVVYLMVSRGLDILETQLDPVELTP